MTVTEYAAALAGLPDRVAGLPLIEVKIATVADGDRIYLVHPSCEPLCYREGRWEVMTLHPMPTA